MKKIKGIVIYDSVSQNTKKVAREIAEELKCEAVFINDLENYKLKDFNLIVLGTPVYGAMPTPKIKRFLRNLKNPEYFASFCTYGVPFFGKIMAKLCLNYMKKNFNYLGDFSCPGYHYYFKTYKNRPNKKDLLNAKIFAEKINQSLGAKNF